MGGAMGVAERLLALEAAVSELRALVASMGDTAGTQPKTRGKSRASTENAGESAGENPKDGAEAAPADSGADDEPSGLERLAQQLGNARMAAVLVRAGYTSPAAVGAAPDEALLAIDGVGEKALRAIREKLG